MKIGNAQSDPVIAIDRADYALLNAVSTDKWVAYLLAADNMDAIMNQPAHGLSTEELVDHFFRLWSRGLLHCFLQEGEAPVTPDMGLAREQFDRGNGWPPTDRAVIYGLSAEGGALWESLTVRDWEWYYRSEGGGTHPDIEWILSGTDRCLVKRLLDVCLPFGLGTCPVPGTEKWKTLQPWQATYWKTFPSGHQVTFQYGHRTGAYPDDPQYLQMVQSAYAELRAIDLKWRKTFEEVCSEHLKNV